MTPEKIDILRFIDKGKCTRLDVLNHHWKEYKKGNVLKRILRKLKKRNDKNILCRVDDDLRDLFDDKYIDTSTGVYRNSNDMMLHITGKGREALYQYDMFILAERRARAADICTHISTVASFIAVIISWLSLHR